MNRFHLLQGVSLGLGLAAAASAQSITGQNGISFAGPITTSITLSPANNPHVIQGDVYVLPGATITIQPGVTFRSTQNSTLAITRGAQIIANGTADAPITFTSSAETGSYRQLANNEWGNLTIMGSGYISEDQIPSNSAAPSASNYADMEGLTPANASWNDYGGGNDNSDSGSISYCSFRYGGRASIAGVELNGLSLGGVGRETDIHHIEVINNLDDGIEIWGGTVNLKYVSIWNVGDDSFDVDQGWRGKAQFGLIVQGLSGNGSQGSGMGDNAMEIDGAERCDWQPVTTAAVHNFTVLGGGFPGNSTGTDKLVEFRDNARVQFLNCIFMDSGDEVVNDQGTDGEQNNTTALCGIGGTAGIPGLLVRMQTPATTYWGVNGFPGAGGNAQAYQAQNPAGHLVEFRGCQYFNNTATLAYPEAISLNVFTGGNGTRNANNAIATSSPITSITRGAPIQPNGSNTVLPVTFLDPTPANAALTAAEFSPNDGFFTPARYVGAFARGNNWLIGWTSVSQYGLTTSSQSNTPIHGVERSGSNGVPVHYTTGTWAGGSSVTIACENVGDIGGGLNAGLMVFGGGQINFPIFGGTVVPTLDSINIVTGNGGNLAFGPFTVPAGLSGLTFYTQFATFDVGVPSGEFAFSNAQRHILP